MSSTKFQIGERVRIKPNLEHARFGWGGAEPGMKGIVKDYTTRGIIVQFPTSRRWHGLNEEFESLDNIYEREKNKLRI